MCGICGVVGLADETAVRDMTELLAHRGPDGAGVEVLHSAGGLPATLGHRRLSILDPTERGAQPMSWRDGRYWITYNGEIYNFPALKRELEGEGVRFRSDCDTEMLLALYERDGADMLHRLNGIYAFAVFDTRTGELFLARDRLGVKPLYYAQVGKQLRFASEPKALLAGLPEVRLRHDALAQYLTFLWVPDPDTLFDGVSKLPPGHCAMFAGGRLDVREWWDLAFAPDDRDADAWAPEVREAVTGSVRRQMLSDVPLGAFLSGGIDSSAIVAAMSAEGGRVPTYTVGFSAEDLSHEIVPDDVRYARQIAAEFRTDYHERVLEADVVDLLPKLMWHLDDPVADPACITTYLICAAAKERMTVILSGMGGDEVYAGYPRHLAAQLTRWGDVVPAVARRALRRAVEGRMTMGRPGRLRGPRRNAMKLLRGIDSDPTERYLTYLSYYRGDELATLLSPDLRSELGGFDAFHRHRDHLARVEGRHWLERMLYLDMKTFLPCLNLAYTDKMSMAASTEVRVPLLDDEVVEQAARIPPELKLRRTTRKFIFKRSMEGVLPKEVIWRPKAGFGAPVRSWLVQDLAPLIEDSLSEQAVRDRGLFEPSEVRRIIDANKAGTEDNALRLWALLSLELWQREFVDAAPTRATGAVA